MKRTLREPFKRSIKVIRIINDPNPVTLPIYILKWEKPASRVIADSTVDERADGLARMNRSRSKAFRMFTILEVEEWDVIGIERILCLASVSKAVWIDAVGGREISDCFCAKARSVIFKFICCKREGSRISIKLESEKSNNFESPFYEKEDIDYDSDKRCPSLPNV
jgi:hypothetical protein